MKNARVLAVILANIAVLWVFAIAARADSYEYAGEGGFKKSFSLAGGQYELYLIAKHPVTGYDVPGFEYCSFAGALERSSPTSLRISLGDAVEVAKDNIFPWKFDRHLTLEAGEYTLWIASETYCNWSFTILLEAKQDSGPSTATPAAKQKFQLPGNAVFIGSLESNGQSVNNGKASTLNFPDKLVLDKAWMRFRNDPNGTIIVLWGALAKLKNVNEQEKAKENLLRVVLAEKYLLGQLNVPSSRIYVSDETGSWHYPNVYWTPSH